eukprot:scaffold169616_cov23-Tisochrysis_lutea.AAC.3
MPQDGYYTARRRICNNVEKRARSHTSQGNTRSYRANQGQSPSRTYMHTRAHARTHAGTDTTHMRYNERRRSQAAAIGPPATDRCPSRTIQSIGRAKHDFLRYSVRHEA